MSAALARTAAKPSRTVARVCCHVVRVPRGVGAKPRSGITAARAPARTTSPAPAAIIVNASPA